MLNIQTATLSELKAYCIEHAIAVIGDKRYKESYVNSIQNTDHSILVISKHKPYLKKELVLKRILKKIKFKPTTNYCI